MTVSRPLRVIPPVCFTAVFNGSRAADAPLVAVVSDGCTQASMENVSQVCQALNKVGLARFPCGFWPHELQRRTYFTVNASSRNTLSNIALFKLKMGGKININCQTFNAPFCKPNDTANKFTFLLVCFVSLVLFTEFNCLRYCGLIFCCL